MYLEKLHGTGSSHLHVEVGSVGCNLPGETGTGSYHMHVEVGSVGCHLPGETGTGSSHMQVEVGSADCHVPNIYTRALHTVITILGSNS